MTHFKKEETEAVKLYKKKNKQKKNKNRRIVMYQNPNTAFELNALYGEMTSNITQIKNIDLLRKMNDMIKKFIANSSTTEKGIALTPALQAKIDKAREQIRNGECVELRGHEDVKKYFASL